MPDTTEAPDIASFGLDYMPKTVPAASEEPPSIERDVFNPEKTQAITQQHADIERERGAQMDYATRQMEGRVEQDRARMDAAYKREAASLDDPALKPWNADKERAERIRGPMEQFGSVANVFAMVASAFTRAPMTSAFNAGAAAMTAIQQHDEKGYESAYAAWKANADLALKRFGMERELFDDAGKLLSTDMTAWRTKQMAIAARFDNKKAIMFLENGMDKELIDMQVAQAKAAEEMRKSIDGMEQFDIRRKIWKDDPRSKGTPAQRLELLQDIAGGKLSTEEKLLRDFRRDKREETGKEPSAQEESDFLRAYKAYNRPLNADQQFIQKFYEEHPDATVEDFNKAYGDFKKSQRPAGGLGGGNANLTKDRIMAQDIAAAREKWKAENKSPEEIAQLTNKMIRDQKIAGATPSGNRIDQMKGMIDRYTISSQTIDKIEALLKRHNAVTGLGGKITRPLEAIGNVFGSNETDRKQFESYISELQEMGSRLLNESFSRPLSSEEKRIQSIIPGLSLQDTTINTAKRLLELQKLFRTLREQMTKRIEGNWDKQDLIDPPKTTEGGSWWKGLPDKRVQ